MESNRTGYVTTFYPLQNAMLLLVEYVCANGHRIKCRIETIDWQTRGWVWG
jgi:hypothetical protein